MSSGARVDMDWAGIDAGQDGASAPSASAPSTGKTGGAYLTDEEILGIEPVGGDSLTHRKVIPSEARNLSSIDDTGNPYMQRDSSGDGSLRNGKFQESATDPAAAPNHAAGAQMPSWMAAIAADPKNGEEAQQLWREHREFRAAFSSPEEARAIKELLPGGVKDVLTLRDATQSVDRIDAAIFSGDARAQSEVVAELARANPAAFRSMFAEAAKVLAGMGATFSNMGADASGTAGMSSSVATNGATDTGNGPTLRKSSEGWGTQTQDQNQNQERNQNQGVLQNQPAFQNRRQDADTTRSGTTTNHESQITNHELRGPYESPVTSHQSPVTIQSPVTTHQSPHFDPAAYAAFERSTNDVVARDVRGAIGDTLARVMPEGVADGAARRIGEDIFNEVHRALAADRALSEQVAGVLSDRRFGTGEQQRVASLLAGRAKQLVPSVARRVIGEWTSTVLDTARSKAARQAAAASRVDIAAPGGSLDSMPLRQMSVREVNYAAMSDEQILGM